MVALTGAGYLFIEREQHSSKSFAGVSASMALHGFLAIFLLHAIFPLQEEPFTPVQIIPAHMLALPPSAEVMKAEVMKAATPPPRPPAPAPSPTKPVAKPVRLQKAIKPLIAAKPSLAPKPQTKVPATAAVNPASVAHSTTPPAASTPAKAATPTYHAASFDAAYLHNPAPAYPSVARRRHKEGTVLLTVLVLPQGRAKWVKLKKSSGFTPLDVAAQQAVERWQFVPAKRGENAVEATVIVPVEFKLSR